MSPLSIILLVAALTAAVLGWGAVAVAALIAAILSVTLIDNPA